jgi:hypothetical protein
MNHRLLFVVAALLLFVGCGTLTRYHRVAAPREEMQSVVDCHAKVAARHHLRRVSCPSAVRLRDRKIDCFRRYVGPGGISTTSAYDPVSSSAIVFLSPVSGYHEAPEVLQAISLELHLALAQRFGGARVELVDDWKQHWIWDVVPLAP